MATFNLRLFIMTITSATLLCTRTRIASIVAIPHIRFYMCQQFRFALARDHESWPAGESRRRDYLRCVTSPLEVRLELLHAPTHNLPTLLSVLRGMCRAAASPTGFRRPPNHEHGLRRTQIRLLRRLHEYERSYAELTAEHRARPRQWSNSGHYEIIRGHS